MKSNQNVNEYLLNGCMRCKFGGTPQCKVHKWVDELELLRQIVLESGLVEEIKWGVPVYTHKGKNVVVVSALKDSANIGFFKGALLRDDFRILQRQGTLQSDRLIRFMDCESIRNNQEVLIAYIQEAIEIEESGIKVIFNQNQHPLPQELAEAFDADSLFKDAFYRLTPGRQRGYIIYITQPKQSRTRSKRIDKCKSLIFHGLGLHDAYKGKGL